MVPWIWLVAVAVAAGVHRAFERAFDADPLRDYDERCRRKAERAARAAAAARAAQATKALPRAVLIRDPRTDGDG